MEYAVSPVAAAQYDAILGGFIDRVPGVRHAIAVGSDGLLTGSSPYLARDMADAMAAITSGLVSLTTRTAKLVSGGRVSLTMIESRGGYLFLLPATDASAVVVWAEPTCDVGTVGYELAVLVSSLEQGNHANQPPAAAFPH
jgi:predicted regulator of Ras-like GTPase activity (Roadblock/LC7/MglB family)